MEQNNTKVSPQKAANPSVDTPRLLLHGEKSPASVTPPKSIENEDKKLDSKETVSGSASAQEESLEADVISLDETEDEIHLHMSDDDETFEDTVEEIAAESKGTKVDSSTEDKYFSDIESSDNSQVYEPKVKNLICAESEKAAKDVATTVLPEAIAISKDKTEKDTKSHLDFELVESDEDFEETRSQEEDVTVFMVEDNSFDTRIPSEEESNSTDFVELTLGDDDKIEMVEKMSSNDDDGSSALPTKTSEKPSSSGGIEDEIKGNGKNQRVDEDSVGSLGSLDKDEQIAARNSEEILESITPDEASLETTESVEAMEVGAEVSLIGIEEVSNRPNEQLKVGPCTSDEKQLLKGEVAERNIKIDEIPIELSADIVKSAPIDVEESGASSKESNVDENCPAGSMAEELPTPEEPVKKGEKVLKSSDELSVTGVKSPENEDGSIEAEISTETSEKQPKSSPEEQCDPIEAEKSHEHTKRPLKSVSDNEVASIEAKKSIEKPEKLSQSPAKEVVEVKDSIEGEKNIESIEESFSENPSKSLENLVEAEKAIETPEDAFKLSSGQVNELIEAEKSIVPAELEGTKMVQDKKLLVSTDLEVEHKVLVEKSFQEVATTKEEMDKRTKETAKSPETTATLTQSTDESVEENAKKPSIVEKSTEKATESERNPTDGETKPAEDSTEESSKSFGISKDDELEKTTEIEAATSAPSKIAKNMGVEVEIDSQNVIPAEKTDTQPEKKAQPSTAGPEIIEIDDEEVDKKTKNLPTKEDDKLEEDEESTTKPTEAVISNEQQKLPPSEVKEAPPAEKKTVETFAKPQPIVTTDDIEMKEVTNHNELTHKNDTKTATEVIATPTDEDESLLMIDTSHKEDNEPEDNDMDTETEQTATSAQTSTDSSSEGSLEVFYDKECVHYECKRGSKNFYRATLFTLNYYKISKKLSKAQYVCEECYDRALNSYEEMCKTLTKKQPLLHNATFKGQEFVEIIDSSDEDEGEDIGEHLKDENVLPKDSIELLEAELEGAIRKVMHNVDIQNQLSWTKQILQQRLNILEEDTEFVSGQLRQLQKKADNMHNSLYQCPKIKIRQLTPLDLNSGRSYNPETESTIPPMGEVLWASIQINETYYAVKNKAIASWVPCKVIESVEGYSPHAKNMKHYKIKFLKSKYPMLKTVSSKHMAFFDPPKVRLPIGTRVIAYFDASSLSRGKEKMLIPSAFYPGIIAEPLKQSNKFRYLVFYDDGYFQYVYHKDVRLVCHASDNVWEDVHHQSREFIHNYLTQYAVNRPMVQTQKGQSMLVDYNGKWIYARVIDVDCSLVQMLFEGQSRSEWIYRGSTRLGPVYKESNNLSQKNPSNTSRISRRTEPFIRYFNGDDSSSSQQSQEPLQQQQHQQQQQQQQQAQQQSKSAEVRAVAKKSVSRTDTSHQSPQPVPTVRHLNNSTIFVDDDNKPKGKVVYYTARKNLPPRDYVPHICSPTCRFNVTHNLSCYSPLAKPLLSGWERQVLRQKSKKFIVYRGPCGKRMRSMEELHRYLRVTDNELNVDNFDFSPDTNCLAEYVIESCIVQKKDISNGEEKMPIPCVNYYDNSMPPDCIYSSRRIPTEGVPLNLNEDFLVGCDCEDDCSDKSKCSCWELTYAGAKYGMPNVPNEMVGYQYKRLYEHVPTGIYECNSRCKCKANCVNRVVQQPLQSKLQVFKTSNRGWGLRCINDVPRGSFICVYAGHLLTEQMANEGGLDAGDEYFAELDYIEVAEQIKEGYESDVVEPDEDEDLYNPDKEDDDEDDDEFVAPSNSHRNRSFNTRSRSQRSSKSGTDVEHDSQERQVISFEPNKTIGQPDNSTSEKQTIRKLFGKDEACYIMDAKITGNLGRYFNHSCSPNLFVQNVFVDTHDLRFPWVAFFAFTHIRAGTELTWNYNYEVGVVPGKVLYCQCGAPNCRQRLL